MPLYECRCERCQLTFEVLAPLSASKLKSRPCPDCGRPAGRIMSAASFSVSGGGGRARSDVTKLKVPPPARLCWMDDRSAARYAAYKYGRGREYDDTMMSRDEQRKKRGLPPETLSEHGHAHDHARQAVMAAKKRASAKQAAARKKESSKQRSEA